jgi:hypothetical protein
MEMRPKTPPTRKAAVGDTGIMAAHILIHMPLTIPVNIIGSMTSIAPYRILAGSHKISDINIPTTMSKTMAINIFQPGLTISQLIQPTMAPVSTLEIRSPNTKYNL